MSVDKSALVALREALQWAKRQKKSDTEKRVIKDRHLGLAVRKGVSKDVIDQMKAL